MSANLFSPPLVPSADEVVEALAVFPGVRIERIVSRGQVSPPGFWYDQSEDEWVALLTGRARLRLEAPDETVELGAGDHLLIRAHRRHRVEWTAPEQPTIWLAVFTSDAGS
jgi:cupin 2 domain-containing protein